MARTKEEEQIVLGYIRWVIKKKVHKYHRNITSELAREAREHKNAKNKKTTS